jgi:hypothetical protein
MFAYLTLLPRGPIGSIATRCGHRSLASLYAGALLSMLHRLGSSPSVGRPRSHGSHCQANCGHGGRAQQGICALGGKIRVGRWR